jgi:signal transduction histidine kinase/CheY-like chemotaxis protein
MARMYGYDRPEEITGSRVSDLLSLDDPANQAFLSAFIRAGYRLTDVESHEHDRHNQPRIFLNNLVGQIENGALVRIWGTQRDITTQKQLEDETRQARRMETAGRLAGGIAHDFNNLLTVILGTSDILLQDPATHLTAREDVDEIKRAATRAASLTRQLLAFSRRQVLQPRIIDLDALVEGVERMLQRLIGEDVVLVMHHHEGLWRIQADPGQLEQVLLNLCVNARDAMPTGGRLTISTGNVDFAGAESGSESVMPRGEYVGMTVEDSGSGMSAEVMQHIFEPFYTTKEPGKGTGLGLATVYGIVKQSDGFIFADSTPGEGSRFRLFFPRVEGTPETVEPLIVTPATPRAVGTILLVEDEESVRRLARRVLESTGYRVLEATQGHEALAIAEQSLGAVDLVITDIVMPGMSGQELSLRLRERQPTLRILYVSGYTDDAILQHGTLLPDTAFLHKPFSPGLLTAKVREMLLR